MNIPSLPNGYTIFCDDIRSEIGDKYSLMGIYSGALNVSSMPVTLPRFSFAITLWEPMDDVKDTNYKISFKPDGGVEVVLVSHDQPSKEVITDGSPEEDHADDDIELAESNIFLTLTAIRLKSPGRFKVRAYRDNKEVRLGTLRVNLIESEDGD